MHPLLAFAQLTAPAVTLTGSAGGLELSSTAHFVSAQGLSLWATLFRYAAAAGTSWLVDHGAYTASVPHEGIASFRVLAWYLFALGSGERALVLA
jgi:hypothetical protein